MAQSTCVVIEADGTPCDGVTGVPGTARGMCSKHYNRWRRHGDPLVTPIIVGNDEARFWSKVDKNGPVPEHDPELGPCWVWTAGLNHDGYGAFSYYNEDRRCIRLGAHRWILGHRRGEHLGEKEEACHRCDNPSCVNPDHLYVGAHVDNMGDMSERGRTANSRVTHCPKGHPYEGDNLILLRGGKKRRCRACTNEAIRERRTRCRNGHPLEGDNLLIVKNGKRKCRTCEEARIAKLKAERAAKTECGNGHPYTDENTVILADGTRACRECRRAASRRSAAKRRAARKAA